MRVSRAWFACLLLLPTASCSGGSAPSGAAPQPTLPERSGPPAGMDESLRDAALELVEKREDALVAGDRDAFLATVDPDALTFAATQARWFDNMAQLPLTDVSYELGDESFMTQVAGAGDLQLPVDFTMRLEGFDERPVTQQMVWTFARDGEDALLADDRNVQVEARSGWTPAPWDLGHIEVRRSDGILGVFDEETVDHADYVMRDLADARAAVRARLPRWSGRFVTYGTSDTAVMDEMSAMSVDDTAAVAFPVLSRPRGPVAAYRFMVNPEVVSDVLSRDLVFRHELVHVAFGTSDDRSPTWLAEGIAEYVARTPFSVDERRRIASAQLVAARARTLEPTRRFYSRDPQLNYALSALVCDFLATTRGEDVLWDLVRTFDGARFSFWTETEDVVRRELGVSTRELSAQALAWARSA
ncbi:hypothetical protein GCM10011376_32170 [Nocardioides flavus (ex Wang et al. 2016)]|uniref:Peptidase MA superfamily protein n=1 Tax=Nocardioides flavus (ex Wang et al. 2016) TaxID=2058780 RepID=A0ABQ3HPQ1_9ACTN|nr:hypothetical protein [Nocardioides flavus (ex Wang et al. 2016)]GHE18607.1 hypothetical protein GCM10011376_32170 [Nocardioides flavus (ex Wang et al. 2016)]